MVAAAGWVVQDYKYLDFAAGPGVAVREFWTPTGEMDYLLVADRKVVGSLEAKKEGETLLQVETQADRYADGFEQLVQTRNVPRYQDRLPFHYMSTGTETLFTSRRDPITRRVRCTRSIVPRRWPRGRPSRQPTGSGCGHCPS